MTTTLVASIVGVFVFVVVAWAVFELLGPDR